jgi:hypothetical protein
VPLVLVAPALGFVFLGQHLGLASTPLAGLAALTASLDLVEQALSQGRLGVVPRLVHSALGFLSSQVSPHQRKGRGRSPALSGGYQVISPLPKIPR